MTDYGMLRSRVPISEIYLKVPDKDIDRHFKQLWDCFGEDVSVITKEFPVDPKTFKVDNESISVENTTDRWVSDDGDCFYYNMSK